MVYTGGDGGFDWDEANVSHIARHGVSPEEAEEVFSDERPIFVRTSSHGEPRWELIGSTQAGRILAVVFTRRNGRPRVVTARAADERERRAYRKQSR